MKFGLKGLSQYHPNNPQLNKGPFADGKRYRLFAPPETEHGCPCKGIGCWHIINPNRPSPCDFKVS